MSRAILILGESGSGKSTSMRNLDPATTGLINVVGKDLPFRGWKKSYTRYNKETNPNGNMFEVSNPEVIAGLLGWINANRPEMKTLIIDDFQYVMSYEFMARVKEVGLN